MWSDEAFIYCQECGNLYLTPDKLVDKSRGGVNNVNPITTNAIGVDYCYSYNLLYHLMRSQIGSDRNVTMSTFSHLL